MPACPDSVGNKGREEVDAYALGIDLVDIGQPFRKNITRHLVPILIPKFSGFSARAGNSRPSIGDRSSHDAPHGGRELEDVCNRRGIKKFVLCGELVQPPSRNRRREI